MLGLDKNGTVTQATVANTIQTMQSVAIGANSNASSAFAAGSDMIRICATAGCKIAFGTNPTANANCLFLPAFSAEYFTITGTSGLKLAVITESTGSTGNVSITEFS